MQHEKSIRILDLFLYLLANKLLKSNNNNIGITKPRAKKTGIDINLDIPGAKE